MISTLAVTTDGSATARKAVQMSRAAGLAFRNDIVSGPRGQQILLDDPSGNPIELFQPAETAPEP